MPDSNTTWNWKVLLADDDPSFHKVGRSTLNGIVFDKHQIETFSSHDYDSTCLFLNENPDTALVILDFCMDEANTGLLVINYIRNQLQNKQIRILLHTSNAQFESESMALEQYAISGFLSKLNATPNQLLTKSQLALRSFSDIRNVQKSAQTNTELEKEISINTRQLLDLSAKMQGEIHKRKKTEQQLTTFNDQLEKEVLKRTQAAKKAENEAIKASNAKTEFLSRMSHELRTPLNAILGFSQLLMADPLITNNERQNESVEQIHIAGNHLLYLVSEILDLSRIEAGKLSVNIDAIDVISVIDNCITTMLPSAGNRNITIELNSPQQLWLMGDHVRVKQVVLNILSNAIKYGPENDAIHIQAFIQNDMAVIEVKDNGPGISEKMQEFLYTPFERCQNSESDVEGTGVGLAITKRLMDLMQGEIAFENLTPKGCLFTLSFPTAQI